MKKEILKHTPLPWYKGERNEGVYRIHGGGTTLMNVDAVVDRDQVSPNTFKGRQEEAKANAEFIIHACNNIEKMEEQNKELIAALKEYVNVNRCEEPIRVPLPNPEGYASKVQCNPCGRCKYCRARAAIAKAEELA